MGAETRVDDDLASVVRLGKLEQKDSLDIPISAQFPISLYVGNENWAHRGEVVDVGHSETDELRGQLLCNNLGPVSMSVEKEGVNDSTLTSSDENLCFIVASDVAEERNFRA